MHAFYTEAGQEYSYGTYLLQRNFFGSNAETKKGHFSTSRCPSENLVSKFRFLSYCVTTKTFAKSN